MLSNNQQKYLRSLSQKKNRLQQGAFTVEGDKICREVLVSQSMQIEGIYAVDTWVDQHADLLAHYTRALTVVNERELKKISNLKTPNQALLVLKQPQHLDSNINFEKGHCLYLENLQDPGNLGTIWRIADWFGLSYIFTSKGCVDWTNPKVIQASMGAFLRVPIIAKEFAELQAMAPTIPSFATVLNGKDWRKVDFGKNGIIIVGNEGRGIEAPTANAADHCIRIHGGDNGGAESLNAAVATGIICAAL